jgi:hypothetical protein
MISVTSDNLRQSVRELLHYYENRVIHLIVTTALPYHRIGEQAGVSRSFVTQTAVKHGVRRPRGSGSPAHPQHKKRNHGEN